MRHSFLIATLLAAASRVAFSQVTIAPPLVYRSSSTSVLDTQTSGAKTKLFDAPGLAFGFSNGGAASLQIKTIRIGVHGRPTCTGEGERRKCVKHVAFSLDLNSNIVDGFKDHLISVREYLLSSSGSPLTLQPHARILAFNSQVDTVPQSYVAGEGVIDGRLIPITDATGKVSFQGAVTIGYSFEGHLSFDIEDQSGTAFLSIKPTLSFLIGDGLQSMLLPAGSTKRAVGSISYGFGYQFGGAGGRALHVSGTYSLDDIAGSQNPLKVGLQQTISALGKVSNP